MNMLQTSQTNRFYLQNMQKQLHVSYKHMKFRDQARVCLVKKEGSNYTYDMLILRDGPN